MKPHDQHKAKKLGLKVYPDRIEMDGLTGARINEGERQGYIEKFKIRLEAIRAVLNKRKIK